MTFSFTRHRFENTFFQDIGLHMDDCVKYDLYEEKVLAGMLVIGSSKTYAKFREGKAFSNKKKSAFFASREFVLQNELGNDFAKIKSILFSKNEVHIRFAGEHFSYKLLDENIARDAGPHNVIIEIVDNNKSVFILNEYEHRKFSSIDSIRPMSGIIEFDDDLDKDKIWGFLVAIQFYFWGLDTD